MLCLWAGVASVVFFFIGLLIAGLLPPPAPTLSGEELVAHFAQNPFGTKFGLIMGMAAATLLAPWSVVLFIQARRAEGGESVAAYVVLGAGLVNCMAFIIPFNFWAPAMYRPDVAPELVRMFHDLGWLEFWMLLYPYVLQTVAVAYVGLTYKGQGVNPFPHRFCYLSLWTAVGVLPAGIVIFFFTGPFAWNGLFAFYLPVLIFCIYYIYAFVVVYKAIKNQQAEYDVAMGVAS
jgi:hypothetical protein